ncbi:hypothetical protein BTE77_27930 [Ensifer adhaerens]|nr:hypothetical protein BTE77_27930 [Ensifer adhaerens]
MRVRPRRSGLASSPKRVPRWALGRIKTIKIVIITALILLAGEGSFALAAKTGSLTELARDETLTFYAIIQRAGRAFQETPTENDPATVTRYLAQEVILPLGQATDYWSAIARRDPQFGFYWYCFDAANFLRTAAIHEINNLHRPAVPAPYIDQFIDTMRECADSLADDTDRWPSGAR